MEFKINKNPYADHVNLYKNDTLVLEPGITALVGCNGSGKTTLLHIIEDKCREMNFYCMKFNNLSDGGRIAIGEKMFRGLTSEAAMRMMQSEGENIHSNIGDFVAKIGRKSREFANDFDANAEVFILLDAVDSGLDIANIKEITDAFSQCIIPDFKSYGFELYVVVSTNSYEFCIGNNCIDVTTLKPININSYEEYRSAVFVSNKKKSDRYEKINNHIKKRK